MKDAATTVPLRPWRRRALVSRSRRGTLRRRARSLGQFGGRIAMRTRKDHRTAFTPDVDGLEEPRLMTAGANQIRLREVVSGTSNLLVITGTTRPDRVTIDDNGSSTAGNVKVSLGDGRTYDSQGAVTMIQFKGNRGSDQVTYNLNGDL